MPLLIPILMLGIVFAMMPLLIPISMIQRFRVGTRRQPARGWLAATNVVALSLSTGTILCTALITNLWLPHAFVAALGGLVAGGLMGLLGLAITRWESDGHRLHYTPNRLLVALILLAVVGRLIYGLWRGWNAWQTSGDGAWLADSGAAGSLAVGAVVIGYYLVFWSGVRRRFKRHKSSVALR